MSSYTVELLRMESQRDMWRRSRDVDVDAAKGATPDPDQPINLSKRAAAVSCIEANKASATAANGGIIANRHCAKGLSHHHSYCKLYKIFLL